MRVRGLEGERGLTHREREERNAVVVLFSLCRTQLLLCVVPLGESEGFGRRDGFDTEIERGGGERKTDAVFFSFCLPQSSLVTYPSVRVRGLE